VQPGFPALLTDAKPVIQPTATSSGRRTAVANWLADAGNPLTARVFVNRQWGQIFGTGILETVNDFGKMGGKPVNPELIDYLADSFVKSGWSVKKLERQILLSSVYRQSSAARADVAEIDPTNRLLASFPRQRLEAEQIRDSLLAAAGLLEEKVGGPAVFPPLPPNIDVGGQRQAWTTSENPHDHHRRSVYVFVRRNTPYPLLDTFDWANPQLVHNKREVTTTAPQALALINSDLVYDWSKALAGRVIREGGKTEASQIDRLFQILYSRSPDNFEKTKLLAFLDSQEAITRKAVADGKKVARPEGFGVSPETNAEVDKLYKVLVGRPADRFEKAALLKQVELRQEKLVKTASADDDEDEPAAAAGAKKAAPKVNYARAAAFVDLVHALANGNEFTYRF
jgi:hypothetical protein